MFLPLLQSFVLLVLFVSAGHCIAVDSVSGPPELIINAKIEDRGQRGGEQLVGTILNWATPRQTWNHEATVERGNRSGQVSIDKSRAVFILNGEEFVVDVSAVQFAQLNGDRIDASDVPGLLRQGRAVALLPKGVAIHPAIAKALHPETIVVTRVKYPSDPLVIDIPKER